MKGKVIPVIGNSPTVIPIFCTCWNINIPSIPAKTNLSLGAIFLVAIFINLVSKKIIMAIKIIAPNNPKLEAKLLY